MSEKNTNSNNSLLIIIVLQIFVIIGIMIFNIIGSDNINLGKTLPDTQISDNTQVPSQQNEGSADNITITVIDDKRCNNCYTSELVSEITSLPFLAGANLEMKDFKDERVEEYLIENNIDNLPAIILNTNQIGDPEFSEFLSPLPNGEYSLTIGATFNPFQEMSDRGFSVLQEGVLEEIRENSYLYGNPNAEITWVEYSDFGCAFCVKMHAEDNTPQKVKEIFGDNLNVIFQHMAFRNQEVPQAIECISEGRGDDFFYDLIEKSFDNRVTNKSGVYNLVDDINTDEVDSCISEGRYASKMQEHMNLGQSVFNVTGTPGNILINTVTGEYEALPGAYPVSEFERVINELMQ